MVHKCTSFMYHFNRIRAGGALFSNVHFSMKKGVYMSQILCLFLIHYELSENKKGVFHSDSWWSKSSRLNQLPHNQLTFRVIRVNPKRVGLLDVAWGRGAESFRTLYITKNHCEKNKTNYILKVYCELRKVKKS